MCQICTLLDNTWPSPKELAKAIVEITPTDDHYADVELKVHRKLGEQISTFKFSTKKSDKYLDDLKIELFNELFKKDTR